MGVTVFTGEPREEAHLLLPGRTGLLQPGARGLTSCGWGSSTVTCSLAFWGPQGRWGLGQLRTLDWPCSLLAPPGSHPGRGPGCSSEHSGPGAP